MKPLKRQSLVEQTAGHLRAGLRDARWQGNLPGVRRLADELLVSKDTVRAALRLMERSGELKPQGAGRARGIALTSQAAGRTAQRASLSIAVLLGLPLEAESAYTQRIVLSLVRALERLGHDVLVRSQAGDRPSALAALVRDTHADAWVVSTGSRARLAWFADKGLPVMALGGRGDELGLPCTRNDLREAMRQVVDALAGHGHRRIVLIAPQVWRVPELNEPARAFIQALSRHGPVTPDYNLPSWHDSAEGIQALLHALFGATPPTAPIIVEPAEAVAAMAFLSRQHLRVPEEVSLVCLLNDPVFSRMRPSIAHFDWPVPPHIRRITRWTRALQEGRQDNALHRVTSSFIPGGTLGGVVQPSGLLR